MPDAPSPYNAEGLQFAWDSTSIALAKDCWRKYYYTQRLSFRTRGDNVHLVFGGHYAKALERFHKFRAAGDDYDSSQRETVRLLLEDSWGWESDDNIKTRETLVRSVVWYLEQFRDDPCKTVILADGSAAVEYPGHFAIGDGLFLFFHLDRLVEYAGQIYVQDQKTTKATLSGYYFKRYNPDNQMSGYTLASQIALGVPAAGVMIDAAQIAVGFTRFERGFTHRTEYQLEEWLDNTRWILNQQSSARDAGWPMNDSACQKYGGCPFLDVCSKDTRVRSAFLETFEKREWNPLAVR